MPNAQTRSLFGHASIASSVSSASASTTDDRSSATVARTPRNNAAEGAPMSRGTHRRFATVLRASAPCAAWDASVSVSSDETANADADELVVVEDSLSSSDASWINRSATCRKRASTVSLALASALGMWPCDFGSTSRRQSVRTAAWFDTSLEAASRAQAVESPSNRLLLLLLMPSANPAANCSAAASALAIPAATSGLSSPPPKYRRNVEATAVQEYSSPATLS
mmetsp:Transcript_13709/g.38586  ORF Transcript_13709/g.38586 Transcript_13709/m.38586 type:complete len:225 (+) Transcript_13709:261-935(+)